MNAATANRIAVVGQGVALLLFAACYAADPSPYWVALSGWSAFWGAKSSHWLYSHRAPRKPSILA